MSLLQTDILIVGAGLAGARSAEALRSLGFDGGITIAGAEPHEPYERPALSKEFLAGARPAGALSLRPPEFWADTSVDLMTGVAVEQIDLPARRARAGRLEIAWRQLVLATGARARRLQPLNGASNVHHLRTLEDAVRLGAALDHHPRLAIIGSGFVGLEVASTATLRGVAVTIVDAAPVPFAPALGPHVGRRLASHARDAGVELIMGRRLSEAIRHLGQVVRLVLDDGSSIGCGTVLVGVGAQPNAELLAGAVGIADDGGIPIDRSGRTAAPGVYACGDVASAPGGRAEHWTAAAASARAVAHAIVGLPAPRQSPAYFWSDQFGNRLQVVGRSAGAGRPELQEGDGWFIARYRPARRSVEAIALLNRPDLLAAARNEVASEEVVAA
jgi:3-phenylpropionate/trans-cinnamate dioxygenase ferredoxin reductase subunit